MFLLDWYFFLALRWELGSAWPTIPQLYVRGNFVGGCDIMVEMLVNGELKRMFEKEGLMKKVKKQ